MTGSNIPTAEETGPNPVDTYRPQDIEKLGIRNATDLTTFIPQEAGGTVNQNIANGGDGTVQLNLRGLLPKETLILVDGKRIAQASLFFGYDIQLIPFSMVDHIDILKDGASAVYGADAVAGVVNFFLIHKSRGFEVGGTSGNTNMGGSNDMGEWEAWLKAGTGDDKTDIVVIADFYQRTGGLFSRDKDQSSNGNFVRYGGFDVRSGNEQGRVQGDRLIPSLFFSDRLRRRIRLLTLDLSILYQSGCGTWHCKRYAWGWKLPVLQLRGFHTSAAAGRPSSVLRLIHPGSVRQIPDGVHGFQNCAVFFDSSLAAVPFTPDPFKIENSSVGFSPAGISVPIINAFNPFTVADNADS